MLVYGDTYSSELLSDLVERLCTQSQTLLQAPAFSLDDMRALLIRAGELEQAAVDALAEPIQAAAEPFHLATALAAEAFYSFWQHENVNTTRDTFTRLAEHATQLEVDAAQVVRVKVPEGFAFYALYPEQYIHAAQQWLSDHPSTYEQEIVIAGVRSAGTTLGALVAAVMRSAGWQTHRFTVRPTGHPFERRVRLTDAQYNSSDWGLVVGEGPGMSGSSMASTAEALVEVGISPSRISFLPGHGGEPGSAASDEVRKWWAVTPRYVATLGDVRFEGYTLTDALKAATHALFSNDPVLQIEDFGGGSWRAAIYRSESDYPAICPQFERPKYRCVTRNGARVLWKFAGLASATASPLGSAEAEAALLEQREKMGYGVPVLGEALGFVATQWINGKRLSHADADPEVLTHIGEYIAAVAGAPLADEEQDAAQLRLRDLLYWNTWELLGEEWAEKTRRWEQLDAPALRYGDGRLAPHEWIRTNDGKLWKTDGVGHDHDQTFIGRQSILWDVAGASVEWALGFPSPLSDAFAFESSIPLSTEVLTFYRAAYAAFRVGQCSLCAEGAEGEALRLQRAATFYLDQLRALLQG